MLKISNSAKDWISPVCALLNSAVPVGCFTSSQSCRLVKRISYKFTILHIHCRPNLKNVYLLTRSHNLASTFILIMLRFCVFYERRFAAAVFALL